MNLAGCRSQAVIGLLVTLFVATELPAQVRETRLSEPDATHPEAFSLVQTVRELSDGRVMVADPLGQSLVVIDLSSGRADTLGRAGQGPGEYRQPDAVLPLPNDSTLLVDLGNARLTVIAPDLSFGETMPIAQGEPGPGGGLLIVLPRGVDSRGRIYFQPLGGPRGPQLPDSAFVLRWDRGSGAMDTVARVKLPEIKRTTSGGAGNQSVRMRVTPLSAQDAWAASWDGRLAVARAGDYHLDLIEPEGRILRSRPVKYEPVPIRAADKQEWLEAQANGLGISVMIENGRRQVGLSRGAGSRDADDAGRYEWPSRKPAFTSNGVRVTPEGEVWVRRHVPAGQPVVFDVFDSGAQLKGRVVVPQGRDLVGFGQGTLFLVRTDELGLQWLERYRRAAI